MSELNTNVVMTGGPHPSSIRIKVGDTKMLGVHSISFDPIDKGQMATVTIKCFVRFGEDETEWHGASKVQEVNG